MKVIIDKISRIHKYKKDWDSIFLQGNFTPFQSYEWLIMLIIEYKNNIFLKLSSKAYIAVLITDKIEILFPFYVKKVGKKRGIFLFGSGGKTDYLDIMHDSGINNFKLHFLLNFISKKFSLKNFSFQMLNSSSLSYKILNQMKESNFQFESECAVIKLPNNSDDYFNNLSKNFRQNIRTAKNRLITDGKTFSFQTFPSNSIDLQKLYDYKKVYHKRYSEKNSGLHFLYRYFHGYDIYFDSFNKVSNCIVSELVIDNAIASYFISFVDLKGGVYISRITYDSFFNRYSPGILLIENFINEVFKGNYKNCSFIDLTNGSETYKYTFQAEKHFSHQIELKMF